MNIHLFYRFLEEELTLVPKLLQRAQIKNGFENGVMYILWECERRMFMKLVVCEGGTNIHDAHCVLVTGDIMMLHSGLSFICRVRTVFIA